MSNFQRKSKNSKSRNDDVPRSVTSSKLEYSNYFKFVLVAEFLWFCFIVLENDNLGNCPDDLFYWESVIYSSIDSHVIKFQVAGRPMFTDSKDQCSQIPGYIGSSVFGSFP